MLGSLFLQNTTNVQIDRYTAGTQTSLRSPALGDRGRLAVLAGLLPRRAGQPRPFQQPRPGSINNQGESKNDFQLSIRTRQQPRRALRSEVNFFSGLLDLSNFQQIKRGASADLNGTLRLQSRYVTHDLSGQVNGNLSRTRTPRPHQHPHERPEQQPARHPRAPARQAGGTQPELLHPPHPGRDPHGLGHDPAGAHVQQQRRRHPAPASEQRPLRERRPGATAPRTRRRAARSTPRPAAQDLGFGLDGRFLLAGWNLESRFSLTNSRSEYPTRAATGGYGESLKVATIDGTLSRKLTRKILLRATGSVSLNSYRYFIIGNYPNPPVNRDQYRQNYRIETQYSGSTRFNSGLVLDVTRNLLVNLRAGSTASNTEASAYRAEWRWSYRMLPGLTATQKQLDQRRLHALHTTCPPTTGSRWTTAPPRP